MVARRQQYAKEKEHWMGLFNEEYNRKILAYKEANNDFSQQIRALKDDKSHLEDKVQEMETKNRALEKARSYIERDYINGRKQCEEIQKSCRALKDQCKQKDQAFEVLMGTKINLEIEIQNYRKVLETEMNDLGIEMSDPDESGEPSSKRRRVSLSVLDSPVVPPDRSTPFRADEPDDFDVDHPAVPASSNSATSSHDAAPLAEGYVTPGAPSSLSFSTMDLTGACLEIKNDSQDPINLDGWLMMTENKSHKYHISQEVIVAPGESVRVVIGSGMKPAPGDIHWNEDVWAGDSANTNEIQLFDDEDQLMNKLRVHREMLPEQNTNKQCSIM